jgi:hypothetical protein
MWRKKLIQAAGFHVMKQWLVPVEISPAAILFTSSLLCETAHLLMAVTRL